MKTLEIKDLHVEVEGKEILRGVDLTVKENEKKTQMGPNRNSETALVATFIGNSNYPVTR